MKYLILLLPIIMSMRHFFIFHKIPMTYKTIIPCGLGIICFGLGLYILDFTVWGFALQISSLVFFIWYINYLTKKVKMRDCKPSRLRKIDKILDKL